MASVHGPGIQMQAYGHLTGHRCFLTGVVVVYLFVLSMLLRSMMTFHPLTVLQKQHSRTSDRAVMSPKHLYMQEKRHNCGFLG